MCQIVLANFIIVFPTLFICQLRYSWLKKKQNVNIIVSVALWEALSHLSHARGEYFLEMQIFAFYFF